MKFSRILAAFLILVLASSSALAAVCAASCASLQMQERVLELESSGMDMHDCHQADSTQQQQQPETEHQNCTMAGCHFSQVVFDTSFKHQIPELISALQPVFISTAISADQPPPIKPPA